MKKTQILLNLSFALLLLSWQTKGQNIYPAMSMDVAYATPSTQCTSLNVDMLEMPRFGGTIQAVAWGDNFGGQDHVIFKVGTSWGGYVTDTLPKYSTNPDIVIADDFYPPVGYVYIVAVVYEQMGAVYMNTYRVWNIPSGTPWLAPISAAPLSTPGSVYPASNPHIDMFADNVNLVPWTNAPSMHEFVITWQENTGNVWDELMAVTGDISAPTTLTNISPLVGVTDISMPDVACYTDINTGDKYAAFIYRKHTGPSTTDYEATTFHFPTFIPTNYTLEANQTFGYPRIEAQSLYDPFSGNAAWMGIGSVRVGGLFEAKMYDANNVGTPTSLSAPLANGLNNRMVSIAAGTGDATTGGIGNTQYTGMLLPGTNPYAYSIPLPLVGGGFPMDYYETNMTALSSAILPVAGISSSSNTGLNLMAVWYDGTDIMYKITGNVNQYKTTSVSKVNNKNVSLYPNPATDKIHISGISGVYNITDITGRNEQAGILSTDNTIDVSKLAPGLHLIRFDNKGQIATVKFTKQ